MPTCWIHSLGSQSVLVLVCICAYQIKKVLFIYFFQPYSVLWVAEASAVLSFHHELGGPFEAHKVELAHSGPTAFSAVASI